MNQPPDKSRLQLHNFPSQPTSFIGRASEVARISELLADPACRLLTLVGTGGVGKTRLAIRTASELVDDFNHDVYFVQLHSIDSADFLAATVADAMDLSLHGQEAPLVQLLTYLADKEMLLVLDNFEHLLPPADTLAEAESVALLTGILETALAVKLLITSREAINLQGEWLFPVQGLPFPQKVGQADEIDAYGAVQLFAERARQVQPDFSLVEERAGVVRICQLVEGMPLALELAASWTKMLPCQAIAAEIEQNLEFLATRLRDVPERHRSMQAVFDQSWQLLTDSEREVFKRLSVFRDGFGQIAAQEIAGATLPLLSGLVDKSLLHWGSEKRYHMHELLRQYAAERLAESPDLAAQVRNRHGAYYADFLQEREGDMLGGRRQREATAEIKAELENIRTAWQWAVGRIDIEAIQKSVYALSLFYQFQSRYREGAKILEQAVHSLDSPEPTGQKAEMLARVLVDQGWLYIRLGRLEQAEAVLERSQAIYADREMVPPPGQATDPLIPLGIVATIQGNYETAAGLGEAARQRSEAHDHQENLAFAFYVLTRAALALGDYQAAQEHAQRAYALVEASDDRYFMAYCLNELGTVALRLGDEATAKQHYQESYRLRERFDDPEGMAVALTHLGRVAIRQQDYAEAKRLYQESLAIYRDIHDRGGLATALNGLGLVACAQNDNQAARQYFQQGLETAQSIQYVPLVLSILCGLGELFLQTEQTERGVELLAFVRHHSASDQETKDRSQQLLTHYETDLSAAAFASAIERGQQHDLAAVTTKLLTKPPETPPSAPDTLPDHPPETDQPLIEPLTTRELEVLRFIAKGHTNQEIADELVIVEGTVKAHASNIYAKLNVNNRTEAVAKAKELDLL